jgi:hypothetical protein
VDRVSWTDGAATFTGGFREQEFLKVSGPQCVGEITASLSGQRLVLAFSIGNSLDRVQQPTVGV